MKQKALTPTVLEIIQKNMSPDVKAQYESMRSEEREVLLRALSDPNITKALYDLDFKQIPVSPKEFLTDPYFIGSSMIWNEKEKRGIYPAWREEMEFILDPANEIYEWILSGALGIGKTTAALSAQMYWTYWLTCLKDPHEFLGLLPSAPIEIFLFSITMTTAEDAGLSRFERLINGSEYFRDTFPANRRRRRKGALSGGMIDYKLEFPPYLEITQGSRDTHFISRDVIGGIMDEANFVPQPKKSGALSYDSSSKAFNLYQGLKNRIESRFMKQGKTYGLLCLISSAASRYDFLEHHKKAQRENRHVRISEFPMYDVKYWEYSGKKFYVLLGTEHANSRIIDVSEIDKYKDDPVKKVIEIPIEHFDAYKRDLTRALKEISGIPSEVVSPLIPTKESIIESHVSFLEHPFTELTPSIGHLDSRKFEDLLIHEKLVHWRGNDLVPIQNPDAPRYIHVDLSATQCACGFAMGHVSNILESKVKGPDGKETTAKSPIVQFDITLQIIPPDPPEQVGYAKIRYFIKYLRDVLHFNIRMVSFDGWQSFDSMQILQNESFESEILSMDKKPDPYMTLRQAFLEGRVKRYPYRPLDEELPFLRLVSEGANYWVEKSANTDSKDISDAVCGVIWWSTLNTMRPTDAELLQLKTSGLVPKDKKKYIHMPIGR